MDRAIPRGNKLCAARVHKRYEAQRMQRLKEMKPQIDASQPKTSSMKHLKTNWKRDEVLGTRYDDIERDNRHLLNKMSKMAQEVGMGAPRSQSEPNLVMAPTYPFPGGPARRNEIARIEAENAKMLKRLQGAHAEYKTRDWEAAHDLSRNYLRRICEYPPALSISVRRRNPSGASLTPLDGNDRILQAGMDPSAVAQDPVAPAAASSGGLRYVFKEHLMIGGSTYFVEMATDGESLAISAYDREIMDTLESLINQENHRRLLQESDGDYGKLASRLRIIDGALAFAPIEAFIDAQDDGMLPEGSHSM